MKREWLEEQVKSLITDEMKRKELIDGIMKVNGEDINKAKSEVETIKAEKKQLEGELETANTTIADLKKNNADNEALQTKCTDYETTIANMKKEHETELTRLARESILTKALGKYKAKNEIAVKALVGELEAKDNADYETLLEAKLKSLSEAEDTKFMFGEAQIKQIYNPVGGETPDKSGIGASMATQRNTIQAPAYDPWGSK